MKSGNPKCATGPAQMSNLQGNVWKIKQFCLGSGSPQDTHVAKNLVWICTLFGTVLWSLLRSRWVILLGTQNFYFSHACGNISSLIINQKINLSACWVAVNLCWQQRLHQTGSAMGANVGARPSKQYTEEKKRECKFNKYTGAIKMR